MLIVGDKICASGASEMPKPEWPGWFDGELTTRNYALLLLVIILVAQDFWVGTEPKLGDSKSDSKKDD